MTQNSLCKNPWAKLAEEIIKSGVQANDQLFLNSGWCNLLRDLCQLDIEAQNARADKTTNYLFIRGAK